MSSHTTVFEQISSKLVNGNTIWGNRFANQGWRRPIMCLCEEILFFFFISFWGFFF